MPPDAFVTSYFDAWNQHDPQGVADHLATHGIYRDVRQNAQRNHPELVAHLRLFFREYRHRYELIGDILSNGDTVAFQYQMIPSAEARRQGHPVYQGAEFVTLEADTATLIADYYEIPDAGHSVITPRRQRGRHRKYAKSGLTEKRMQAYMQVLDRAMRDDEAYLDTELTLPLLAERIDCSVNHLSQVINAGFGMSFFDYVNRFRIHHATRILDRLDDRAAVLRIAYSVGFNSNSAFYSAFRKHIGMTPAQYRRSQAKDA